MNPSLSFTNSRNVAIHEFYSLRLHAVKDALLAKLFRTNNTPRNFEDGRAIRLQTRRFAGVQNIRVDQIVGTLGREVDFDRSFRPLKKHLRDRWVNAFLRLNTDGWQPIIVHKLDNSYYVEDGHHRVSVAQFVGMVFIEAEVWDHTFCPPPRSDCKPRQELARRHAEVCCVHS